MKRESSAAARFFIRIGQAGAAAPKRDEATLPLFPLPLIMDAEGVLSQDARHLVNDEAEYMRRVRELLHTINLRMV
jgi:hypothetical protein